MELGLVVHEQGGWTVLAVTGELDMATAPAVRERLHGLLAAGHDRLIVDLGEVGFLDSTALGVLVGLLKRVRTQGGDLRLVCNQPRVLKVFEITRLDQAFTIHDSVDAAVAE